jgi:selenocysteine-specific elongation factor
LCGRVERAKFQPPTLEELGAEVGANSDRVESLMELLVDQGRVHHVGAGVFLSETAMERARAAVRSNCEDNGELDIPTLRDQLGTTRKFLIPLLEHFDSTGLTVRSGANRVLKRR